MRVLLTGATSFTGAYIAKALKSQGIDLFVSSTRDTCDWNQLENLRWQFCELKKENLIEKAPLDSFNFLECIENIKPEVFINHGAPVGNFRSPEFSLERFKREVCESLDQVFSKLKLNGAKTVIHSGSEFEDQIPDREASRYTEAKKLQWNYVREYGQKYSIKVIRVAIPNPFGPLESESKLLPRLIKAWTKNETLKFDYSAPAVKWVCIKEVADRFLQVLSEHQSIENSSSVNFFSEKIPLETLEKICRESFCYYVKTGESFASVKEEEFSNQQKDRYPNLKSIQEPLREYVKSLVLKDQEWKGRSRSFNITAQV